MTFLLLGLSSPLGQDISMGSTVEILRERTLKNRNLSNTKYREWYQDNHINQSVPHWLHPLFNFGVLIATIIFSSLQVQSWSKEHFAAGLFTLLAGNLVVFLLHRYPLHRRYKISPFPYDRHTVEHHRYYDYHNIILTGARDFKVIFFPWFIILSFVVFVSPIFFGLGYFLMGPDLGWFLLSTTAGYFTLYEIVHLSCHLPLDHWFLKLPGLKAMHEHHRLHHHPRLMAKYNFCIVYPLFDYIFGTKYKGEVLAPDTEAYSEDIHKNLE